jgi:hypothetical protein
VVRAEESLGVQLVDVLGPEGRAANQPFAVTTFNPPIAAPFPGAVVSIDSIRSPANVSAVISLGNPMAVTRSSSRWYFRVVRRSRYFFQLLKVFGLFIINRSSDLP